jgi:hypothetical protein
MGYPYRRIRNITFALLGAEVIDDANEFAGLQSEPFVGPPSVLCMRAGWTSSSCHAGNALLDGGEIGFEGEGSAATVAFGEAGRKRNSRLFRSGNARQR